MSMRFDSIGQDVRFALRMLARNPGFTAAVLLTLGLGIGASTAVFAVVEGILLRPLPFPAADRLYRISQDGVAGSYWLSVPNYDDMKERLGSFEAMGAYTPDGANVVVAGEPERLSVAEADADFFSVMGVRPVLGRTFTEAERLERAPVAVVSNGLWRRRLGGRADVIGETLVLDGSAREVIGVLPPGPMLPADADVWTPIHTASPAWRTRRGISWIQAVGRLKADVPVETARAEARTLAASLRETYPAEDAKVDIGLRSLEEAMVGGVRTELRILMTAVVLLLAVAAINAGGLVLARATARREEIVIRSALGGGRGRLIGQMATESVVVGTLGLLLGLIVARAGVAGLVTMAPADTPRVGEVSMGSGALLFAMGAAAVAMVFLGALPGVTAIRGPGTALRSGRTAAAAGGAKLRGGLVVAQVALTLALLAGAGLLGKSFWRLQQVDPGFESEDLLVAGLPVGQDFATPEAREAYYRTILERGRGLPGVRSAALTSSAPFTGFGVVFNYDLPGRPAEPGNDRLARFRIVTPELFATLGIPFRSGATFPPAGVGGDTRGAVVSEELPRLEFAGRDPLGATIVTAGDTFRIVGVVGAIRDVSPRSSSPFPHVYVQAQPATRQSMTLVLRAAGDPTALMGPLRRALREVAPAQPITPFRPMRELLADSAARARFTLSLLAFFASATLALAAIGIYGLLAYNVARRTREIGLRVALGAPPAKVSGLIVRRGLALAVAGVAAGAVLTMWGVRLLRGELFEVEPFDPAVLGGVAILVIAVAFFAAWAPARRAMRIGPAEALRVD